MWLLRPPGVYRPQGDTFLLAEALKGCALPAESRVLDLCTGTGALAVTAALGGARDVTAVDASRRAVLAARLNSALRGLRIRVLHGDLLDPVSGQVFDAIVTNPPYVPSTRDPGSRRRGRARSWDAGPRGRAVLDRICAHAPPLLAHGGTLLVVHSALCGVNTTLESLRAAGLKAAVVARRPEPFGPVMRSRARWLEACGLIEPGGRQHELVVIRADHPAPRR